MTRGENIIASSHPSDQLSLNAFKSFGAQSIIENLPVVQKSDIIFISVKPNVVETALNDVKESSSGKLFVSIAMGVTLNQIEKVIWQKF